MVARKAITKLREGTDHRINRVESAVAKAMGEAEKAVSKCSVVAQAFEERVTAADARASETATEAAEAKRSAQETQAQVLKWQAETNKLVEYGTGRLDAMEVLYADALERLKGEGGNSGGGGGGRELPPVL